MLANEFFNREAIEVAQRLIGKVLYSRYRDQWLCAQIIETEAYYLHDKASHASLGFTPKRRALFMPAGTIYMYYSRGGPSLNISAQGDGNAVLIKSAVAPPTLITEEIVTIMQQLHATRQGLPREVSRLCSGQTLLCRSLHLHVNDWNQQSFDSKKFYIADIGYLPKKIIQTTRLGIPAGRDEYLPYRFVDYDFAKFCTKNPLTTRVKNYTLIDIQPQG